MLRKLITLIMCAIMLCGCGSGEKKPTYSYKITEGESLADMSDYVKYDADTEYLFYKSDTETLMKKMDDKDTFIMYVGYNTCPYCNQLMPILNACCAEVGWNAIEYVDVYNDPTFQENALTFVKKVEADKADLPDDEIAILVPIIAFVREGVVTDYFVGVKDKSYNAEDGDLTEEQRKEEIERILNAIEKMRQ